jgi:hypothetical protein
LYYQLSPVLRFKVELKRPTTASGASRFNRLWIASLMKNSDNHYLFIRDVVEKRVGKPVQKYPPERTMHDLKCEWSFLHDGDRVVHFSEKVVS